MTLYAVVVGALHTSVARGTAAGTRGPGHEAPAAATRGSDGGASYLSPDTQVGDDDTWKHRVITVHQYLCSIMPIHTFNYACIHTCMLSYKSARAVHSLKFRMQWPLMCVGRCLCVE